MKASKGAMSSISMRLGLSENQLQAAPFVSGLIDLLLEKEDKIYIIGPKIPELI
jgi:hypothetical protein